MLSKNKIKFLQSLRLKKYRDEYKQFLAEGEKLVNDLLIGSAGIVEIYAQNEWLTEKNFSTNITVYEITETELSKISQLSTPNKVVALINYFENQEFNISQLNTLVLALDDIKDPGNLGTIVRIADWFGITDIFCSKQCVDIYNPKVVQSTMGSIARVHVYYTELSEFLMTASEYTTIYGALLEGDNIYKSQLTQSGIVVIGNESRGISENIMPYIHKKLKIPSFSLNTGNSAESLNASVATAIFCSEFKRNQF